MGKLSLPFCCLFQGSDSRWKVVTSFYCLFLGSDSSGKVVTSLSMLRSGGFDSSGKVVNYLWLMDLMPYANSKASGEPATLTAVLKMQLSGKSGLDSH